MQPEDGQSTIAHSLHKQMMRKPHAHTAGQQLDDLDLIARVICANPPSVALDERQFKLISVCPGSEEQAGYQPYDRRLP